MSDDELLEQFVRSFQKFDDLLVDDPVPPEFCRIAPKTSWTGRKWKPAAVPTDETALNTLYCKLPGRFPPLYEQLILSYRWLEVELGDIVRLMPNPPGPMLQVLLEQMTADPVIVDVLFPLGLMPFGKARGGCYDPVCFDLKRRCADGDCAILRVEHESVLCERLLGESWEVAPSLRSLVETVIYKAGQIADS